MNDDDAQAGSVSPDYAGEDVDDPLPPAAPSMFASGLLPDYPASDSDADWDVWLSMWSDWDDL